MRTLVPAPTSHPRLKDWNVAEYLAMTEAGIFAEGARVELIDGQIVERTGMGTPHYKCSVKCFLMLLKQLEVGVSHIVTQQLPIALSDRTEPEPDLCVVRGSAEAVLDMPGKPTAADIALLIEVSDSTYGYDSTTKLSQYAITGIQEYWIVNLTANVVEQHTAPMTVTVDGETKGQYGRKLIHRPGDVIESLELGSFDAKLVLE